MDGGIRQELCVRYAEFMCLTLASFTLEKKDIGVTVGTLSSTGTWIAGIALSIYVTVLNNRLGELTPSLVTLAAEGAGLNPSTVPALLEQLSSGALENAPGLTPKILSIVTEAYQTAFSRSADLVYLISIAFGALAIVSAFFSPNAEAKFDAEIARRMHGKSIAELELKNVKIVEG